MESSSSVNKAFKPLACPICFEEIAHTNLTVTNCCKQFFHYDCLFSAKKIKKSCPLCRASLKKSTIFEPEISSSSFSLLAETRDKVGEFAVGQLLNLKKESNRMSFKGIEDLLTKYPSSELNSLANDLQFRLKKSAIGDWNKRIYEMSRCLIDAKFDEAISLAMSSPFKTQDIWYISQYIATSFGDFEKAKELLGIIPDGTVAFFSGKFLDLRTCVAEPIIISLLMQGDVERARQFLSKLPEDRKGKMIKLIEKEEKKMAKIEFEAITPEIFSELMQAAKSSLREIGERENAAEIRKQLANCSSYKKALDFAYTIENLSDRFIALDLLCSAYTLIGRSLEADSESEKEEVESEREDYDALLDWVED
jgi:hypothetical protein